MNCQNMKLIRKNSIRECIKNNLQKTTLWYNLDGG